MANIQTKNLSVFFNDKLVLDNISMSIPPKKMTAIIGPNGSGKSTLLKTLCGLIKPKCGEIVVNGQALTCYTRKTLAKKISFLMQNPEGPEDITVKQLVDLGRYSYQGWLSRQSEDDAKIQWAIKQVDLESLQNEPLASLSGGQRQRAWIAMALAQDSDSILFDEPTSFLDIRHQIETLSVLRNLTLRADKTIVIVLHDIQMVMQFADYLMIIDQGRVVYHDEVNAMLDTTMIEDVFGVKVKLFENEKHPLILTVQGLKS